MGHSVRPMFSHVHKFETKLENQIQGLVTTDIAPIDSREMLNCNTQNIYWNELDFYGLDYDNQPSLVNGLPSPRVSVNGSGASPSPSEPTKLDLDAYKAFKKCLETQHQKHLELVRLELSPDSQEKLNVYVNKKCLKEIQSEATRCLEYTRYQVMDSLRNENVNQIDLEQQKVVDEMRFNLGLWQEEASRNLEDAHSQAMENLRQENLNQMVDYEVDQQQEQFRFEQISRSEAMSALVNL